MISKFFKHPPLIKQLEQELYIARKSLLEAENMLEQAEVHVQIMTKRIERLTMRLKQNQHND